MLKMAGSLKRATSDSQGSVVDEAPTAKGRKLELETELRGLLEHNHNESRWIGKPIMGEAAKARFPNRKVADVTPEVVAKYKAAVNRRKKDKGVDEIEGEDKRPTVLAFFEAVELDTGNKAESFTVNVGEFVEVIADEAEKEHYVAKVVEFFETVEATMMLTVHWYYCPRETRLAVMEKKDKEAKNGKKYLPGAMTIGEGLLFRAADNDNKEWPIYQLLDSVHRKVTVAQVKPGDPYPTRPTYDYWWDLEHSRQYFTFSHPLDFEPESVTKARTATEPREIAVLDLYCGAGGMSEGMDAVAPGVVVKTKWAVDYAADMCLTFKANHPDTVVFNMGVDEFLMLCQKYKELSDMYPDDWCPDMPDAEEVGPAGNGSADSTLTSESSDDEEAEEEEQQNIFKVKQIIDIRLADSAERGKSGQTKGNLTEPLTPENCWLEFKIHWKGFDKEEEKTWEPRDNLLDCQAALAKFVQATRQAKKIPLYGDVQMVMGGPPCQGVSGLNRHAETTNILLDARNRQALAFYDVVSWFRPNYVLMENVVDILKKDDGVYAKFSLATLLHQRYQCRLGILPACSYGAPQGRYRVFVFAARSGVEQLPPFPEPTHRTVYRTAVPVEYKDCRLEFLSDTSQAKAYPAVVMGDVFGDLPEVSNFCIAERADYQKPPERPLQLWLRREPPAWAASRDKRTHFAEAQMRESHNTINKSLQLALELPNGHEKVGRLYFNKKDPQKALDPGKPSSNYAAETWAAFMRGLPSEKDRKEARDGMEGFKKHMAILVGNLVAQELENASRADGPVRDHRPLTCNVDDYLRCAAVPKHKGANFRNMEGVITNEDGRPCVGHTHAALSKGGGTTSCAGGGTRSEAPRCRDKSGRVDQHDKDGWRGASLEGCTATTVFMETGDLLCPRWCITYQRGKSKGRQGCFGRMWYDEVQPTVVGRAEPHNLAIVHPAEDRVVSIRENARTQMFPDYYTLVGIAAKAGNQEKGWVRSASLNARYTQMGNAVCPAVASALSRCLVLAATGGVGPEEAVVAVRDIHYDEVMKQAKGLGLKFYIEEHPELQAMLRTRDNADDGEEEDEEDEEISCDD